MDRTFAHLSLYMAKRAPILIGRRALQITLGLLTFTVLARYLSEGQFAVYNLVFSFIAIFRLTTLPGLGIASFQAFARRKFGVFGTAVKLSFGGSILGAIILMGTAGWHYYVGDNLAGAALFCASILLPATSGLQIWRNAAAGAENYVKLLLLDCISSGLRLLGVICVVLLFPVSVPLIIFGVLVGPALVNIFATTSELRKVPQSACSENGSIRYGLKTTLYQVPTTLSQQLDKMVLYYLVCPEAMAAYSVALRLPELARTVIGESNVTLGPVFARVTSYNTGLRIFSCKLSLVYTVLSVLGAVLIIPYFLPLLAGGAYTQCVPLAQVMMVSVGLGSLGDIQFRYIKSHLDSKNFLKVTLTKAAFDTIAVLLLAYYLGLTGVVASYILKNLGYSVITSIVTRRNRGESSSASHDLVQTADIHD